MSAPDQDWLLNEWLRMVQARWVVIGIPRGDRVELLRRLRKDVAEARAAGATIEDLISTPPHVFADSISAGLRSRHEPIDTGRLLVTILTTGATAGTGAWLVLVLLSRILEFPSWVNEGGVFLFVDLFLIAGVLAVMVGSVRWACRSHADIAALIPRLALTLTVATLVGFAPSIAFGAIQGYSLSGGVVAVEVLIVVAFLAVGVSAAQHWTWPSQKRSARARTQATS